MANYDRNVRAESWGWLIAAILVTAVAVLFAWNGARRNERLAGQIITAEQARSAATVRGDTR